jgi:LAO/AO transport system kinase
MADHDRLAEGPRHRARAEIEAIALADLRARIRDLSGAAALGELAERVVAGELDPYAAADEVVASVSS